MPALVIESARNEFGEIIDIVVANGSIVAVGPDAASGVGGDVPRIAAGEVSSAGHSSTATCTSIRR